VVSRDGYAQVVAAIDALRDGREVPPTPDATREDWQFAHDALVLQHPETCAADCPWHRQETP
jgi:hypothetical protein